MLRVALPILALCLCAAQARAQEESPEARRAAAKALKDEGTKAYESGQHELALDRFRAAHRIYPSPNLRYNIALALIALDRPAQALEEFEAFLGSAQDAPEEARAYAREKIRQLEASVASIVILCNVEDAIVLVDDEKVGKTPLPRALRLTPGDHRIEVEKSGHPPFRSNVRLARGQNRRIEAFLGARAGGAVRDLPPTEPSSSGSGLAIAGLVTGAVGAALLGTGVYFGIRASSKADDLDRCVAMPSANGCQDLQGLKSDGESADLRAKIFLVAGGAGLLGGGLLYYFGKRAERSPAQPSLSFGLGSVSLRGTF